MPPPAWRQEHRRAAPWEPAGDLLRGPASFRSFPFVEVDEAERVLTIRPGEWRVERDLVIPEGWRVRAGAGTHLDLVGSALIVSRSRRFRCR